MTHSKTKVTKKKLKELMKEKREFNKCSKSLAITTYLHDKLKNTDENFDKLKDDEVNFHNHLTDLEKIQHNKIRLSVLCNQLEFIRSSLELREFGFDRNFYKHNNETFIENINNETKLINEIKDLRKKQGELILRKHKHLFKIQRQIHQIKKAKFN